MTPRVDLGINHVGSGSLRESGAQGAGLVVDGDHDTFFSVQPAVEVGGEIDAGDGVLVRPKAALGITYYFGDDGPSVATSFQFAPGFGNGFRAEAPLDDVYVDLAAGVEILANDRVTLSAQGFGSLSSNTESFGGGLTLELAF